MSNAVTPSAVVEALVRDAQALARAGEEPLVALRALIDRLSFAALIADDDGAYVLTNAAATRLTGYSTRELSRLWVWDLTSDPNKHHVETLWRAFIQQRGQRGDYTLVTKAGRVVTAEYAARANVLPHLHVSILGSPRRPEGVAPEEVCSGGLVG
jgi:PAS domain S-box-containing protein